MEFQGDGAGTDVEPESAGDGDGFTVYLDGQRRPQMLHRHPRGPLAPELEAAEEAQLGRILDRDKRERAKGDWTAPGLVAVSRDGAVRERDPAEGLAADERQVILTHAWLNRPATRDGAPPALTGEQRARVETAAAAARSEQTTAVYASQWGLFTSWADSHRLEPMPAHPATVAAYLADRAEQGASVSTLRVASAAIGAAHRDRGLPDPTKHEGVARTVSGVSRQQAGRQKRQARALTTEAMAAIRATARLPRPWADGKRQESPEVAETRGNLDVALCAVLRDGMLRRAEAAALTWADIQAAEDGSGRLTVRRSKTDQTGEGAVLFLSPQTMTDLERIRPQPADPAALVFGLGPAQIGRRVQAAAKAANLDGADLYSGHSGRVGMAQDLVKDGATLPELMQAGRWASPDMPARYARNQLANQGAVARFYRRNTTDPAPGDSA